MLNQYQINELLDGCALLECLGNLYEFIGSENGKYIFQNVNNDSYIKCSYKSLLTMPEYDIQY